MKIDIDINGVGEKHYAVVTNKPDISLFLPKICFQDQ